MTVETNKVLIVDDSKTNLALLRHTLDQEGCEVLDAQSGPEAIELVEKNDFALILLDIQMPGMNGYETAHQIKKSVKGQNVPIIFITAIFQDAENVKQGYKSGAVDYLFRPVDIDTLKSKVRVFLQMHSQKRFLEKEIEAHIHSEKCLSDAEERYRSIFERAVEGIFQATLQGEFKETNQAMVQLFEYETSSELLEERGARRKLMVHESDYNNYLAALNRDGYIANFEFEARKKDGSVFWCSENSRLIVLENGDYLVEGVLKDVTARKQQEEKLRYLATIDNLTEIPNRHLFFDRLEHALAHSKRYDERLAVLFIDLNEFKQVNDTYGHQAGDDLLKGVAKRLHKRIREADTLARLGGDEFGVLLTAVKSEKAALTVADSLVKCMDEPFDIQGELIRVGATIGISHYPDDGKDCVSLISRADAAMYGVKRDGCVQYGVFKEFGVPR